MATNAETPSSSGTPAATAAPNASSRISSVPPIENCMDFASSARLRGAERLLRRRVAVLLDAQLRVGVLDRGDGGERRFGRLRELRLVRRRLELAREREVHDHGAAVLGDGLRALCRVQRALDVRDAVDLPEPAHDVLHRGGDRRIIGLDRALALDEHALADRLGEARVVDDHRAALGLAVAARRLLEVLLADLAADEGGEDDEEDPADDGRLAVGGTPSAGACREVARLHGAPGKGFEGDRCSLPAGPASLPGGLAGVRLPIKPRWAVRPPLGAECGRPQLVRRLRAPCRRSRPRGRRARPGRAGGPRARRATRAWP